jgi:hypothetical protein
MPFAVQQAPLQVQMLHFATAHLRARVGRRPKSLWAYACTYQCEGTKKMLWTICIILLILWVLGMATAYTAGGLLHLLLLVAVVVMVFRLIQGRRVV